MLLAYYNTPPSLDSDNGYHIWCLIEDVIDLPIRQPGPLFAWLYPLTKNPRTIYYDNYSRTSKVH